MVYVQQHQFEISCLLKHKSIIIMWVKPELFALAASQNLQGWRGGVMVNRLKKSEVATTMETSVF